MSIEASRNKLRTTGRYVGYGLMTLGGLGLFGSGSAYIDVVTAHNACSVNPSSVVCDPGYKYGDAIGHIETTTYYSAGIMVAGIGLLLATRGSRGASGGRSPNDPPPGREPVIPEAQVIQLSDWRPEERQFRGDKAA